MLDQEKKYQRQALIGTVIFHTLLLILLSLPFMSLTYQDPPLSKNKGISIDFGSDNSQNTNLSKSQQSNNQESIVNVKVEAEDIQAEVEEVKAEAEVMQTEVENVQIEVEDVQIEVEKKQIESLDPSLENILKKGKESMKSQNDSGNKNNRESNTGGESNSDGKSNSDGESNSDGKSNSDGESNSYGGGSGSKNSLVDITRTPENIPQPKGNHNENGSVIVKITVNPKGKVIKILSQVVPSHVFNNKIYISSNDPTLIKNAIKAANESTFKEKTSIDDDVGYLIFTFETR